MLRLPRGLSEANLLRDAACNMMVERSENNIEITVLEVIDNLMACGVKTATNCWVEPIHRLRFIEKGFLVWEEGVMRLSEISISGTVWFVFLSLYQHCVFGYLNLKIIPISCLLRILCDTAPKICSRHGRLRHPSSYYHTGAAAEGSVGKLETLHIFRIIRTSIRPYKNPCI